MNGFWRGRKLVVVYYELGWVGSVSHRKWTHEQLWSRSGKKNSLITHRRGPSPKSYLFSRFTLSHPLHSSPFSLLSTAFFHSSPVNSQPVSTYDVYSADQTYIAGVVKQGLSAGEKIGLGERKGLKEGNWEKGGKEGRNGDGKFRPTEIFTRKGGIAT